MLNIIFFRHNFNSKLHLNKGMALFFAISMLCVLTIITITLVVCTRFEHNGSCSHVSHVKACYLAEAGVYSAISSLKDDARNNFVYANNGSALYAKATFYNNRGSYSVDVEDEQRKLNIRIDHITPSTIRILQNLGLSDQQIANLIDYQDADDVSTVIGSASGIDDDSTADKKDASLEVLEEIMTIAGIDKAAYDAHKSNLTIYSYSDPNTIDNLGSDESRCPVNINTASKELIAAILTNISDGIDIISATEADTVAADIISQRPYTPPDGWFKFDNCIKATSLNANKKQIIKNNANPNRTKPAVYTTDFCFFSGGKYTLISTGALYNPADAAKMLAEKKIKVIIDIYGILNQTKKEQFQGSDDDTTPVAFQVTTYDSCPVESIDSTNDWNSAGSENYPITGNYKVVHNAIKNGFWDNMDDASSIDRFYVDGHWRQANSSNRQSYLWVSKRYGNVINNEDLDADEELVFILGAAIDPWHDKISITYLGPASWAATPADLVWHKFSWRSEASDNLSTYQKREQLGAPYGHYIPRDVIIHMSRWQGDPIAADHPRCDAARMQQEYDIGGVKTDNAIGQLLTYVGEGSGGGWEWSGHINDAYYIPNIFIAVHSADNDHDFYAYKADGKPDFQLYQHNTNTSNHSSGQVGWEARGAMKDDGDRSWVDNVRIIPESGAYFESEPLSVPASISGNVSWGTISATVTLSSGGDYSLDEVNFETKTTGGWQAASGGSITSSDASSIQYKANFSTNDKPGTGTAPYFSETIALEDIFITYLPETKIYYYHSI